MTLLELEKVNGFVTQTLEKNYDKKIDLEIGCGNGHFISEYAKLNTERLFIGIEIKKQRCLKSLKKVENNKLTNVQIVNAKAEELLNLLPDNSIHTIHIYFPDPWPKNKHRKRRFLRYPTLNTFHRVLRTKGRIYFVTDFFDYYIQTKILFIKHPHFTVVKGNLPQNVLNSIYGQKFVAIQKPIHSIIAMKI